MAGNTTAVPGPESFLANGLLEVDGISKQFASTKAVQDLRFTVDEGRFIAIMGPSGCGKTTTLRLLAGLEVPDSGELRYRGERMNEWPAWERPFPLVWQNLALFPFLSVAENVEYGLRARGVRGRDRRVRVDDWLGRMEIGDLRNRFIHELSGGQMQRVALARSLVLQPEMLLLDEPLSALDAHLRIRMQDVLLELQRDLGITFCYVTHSQSEAFAMADRIVIMNAGGIEQDGAPADIYDRPETPFVARFIGAHNLIDGIISSHSNAVVNIKTDLGVFTTRASGKKPLRPGDRATLAVRIDGNRLSRGNGGSGKTNGLVGRIISEEFNGSLTVYNIATATGGVFRAQERRDQGKSGWEHNQEVWIEWDEANSFALAY